MNKIIISLLVIVCYYSYGQEPHGGSLYFKVYKEGELIKFPNNTWEINAKNSVFENRTIIKHEIIYANDYYTIEPEQTLGGGLVSDEFYLDIIHNKDTMRIYPPSFKDQFVELDSISFRKGTFTIPESVHDFRVISKKIIHHHKKTITPNIYSDWELFTHETYKCYIEQIESLDYAIHGQEFNYVGGKSDWRKWESLYLPQLSDSYSYYENVIVKYNYFTEQLQVFEVKDVSNIHYSDTGSPRVVSLYYKDNNIFAIINKSHKIIGIYKLHFVKDKPSKKLDYLKKKQLTEEYDAFKKNHQSYYEQGETKFTKDAEDKFNHMMKSIENE
jgi:hypothetical protein